MFLQHQVHLTGRGMKWVAVAQGAVFSLLAAVATLQEVSGE